MSLTKLHDYMVKLKKYGKRIYQHAGDGYQDGFKVLHELPGKKISKLVFTLKQMKDTFYRRMLWKDHDVPVSLTITCEYDETDPDNNKIVKIAYDPNNANNTIIDIQSFVTVIVEPTAEFKKDHPDLVFTKICQGYASVYLSVSRFANGDGTFTYTLANDNIIRKETQCPELFNDINALFALTPREDVLYQDKPTWYMLPSSDSCTRKGCKYRMFQYVSEVVDKDENKKAKILEHFKNRFDNPVTGLKTSQDNVEGLGSKLSLDTTKNYDPEFKEIKISNSIFYVANASLE